MNKHGLLLFIINTLSASHVTMNEIISSISPLENSWFPNISQPSLGLIAITSYTKQASPTGKWDTKYLSKQFFSHLYIPTSDDNRPKRMAQKREFLPKCDFIHACWRPNLAEKKLTRPEPQCTHETRTQLSTTQRSQKCLLTHQKHRWTVLHNEVQTA